MRVWITKTSTVGEWPSLEAWVPGGLCEPLSPLDASPFVYKTVNCVSLSFSYALSFDTLLQATQLLARELPIIAGRLTAASKADIARHPYLKATPYTITVGPQHAGVLVCEAATDAAAASLDLNREVSATPYDMNASTILLPPWFQPLDMAAFFKGHEPLLKLQLTHCSDGGCVLAATMPHVLTDSFSTCLLFTRLSQLYRQAAGAHHLSPAPPQPVVTATAAAAQSSTPSAAQVAAAAAAPAGVDASTDIPSSKSLLIPKQGARLPTAEEMKAMSQGILSWDVPSLFTTLKCLAAMMVAARSANQRFPGSTTSLSSVVLRIPDGEVAALKAAAASGTPTQHSLSTNDALAALAWLLFCDLRGRPLPGSSSSTHHSTSSTTSSGHGSSYSSIVGSLVSLFWRVMGLNAADAPRAGSGTQAASAPTGVLLMTVDMRHNCSSSSSSNDSSGSPGSNDGSGSNDDSGSGSSRPFLPKNYFGNAANGVWMPHPRMIEASRETEGSGIEGSAGAAPTATSSSSDASLMSSLSAAAGAVRGAVNSLRACEGSGDLLLRSMEAQLAAPASVMMRNMTRTVVELDGVLTSWRFPIAAVDFGAGPPIDYCCLVRNIPPWVAAVLPRLPHEQCTRLVLTVPTSALPALRQSPVLQQLVPGAVLQC